MLENIECFLYRKFLYGFIYLLQATGGEKLSIAESLKATAEAVVMEQSGFVYDQNSGLYYDYNTGYYYDNVSTVKPVLSGHSKKDPKYVFKTDNRLM